jgi:hypothetical protein
MRTNPRPSKYLCVYITIAYPFSAKSARCAESGKPLLRQSERKEKNIQKAHILDLSP